MVNKIILFSTELLPMGDVPATGWGVRGKGIYESLKGCGFDMYYAPLKNAIEGKDNLPSEITELAFDKKNVDDIIKDISPDVIIFSPWPSASELDQTDIPVVIDLGGPIILENLFIPDWDIIHPTESKIEALSKGDFFIVGNKRQKYYYLLWLILAGLDLKTNPMCVVPITLSTDLPEHSDDCYDKFVTGGVFYPWQNPFNAINAVVKGLDEAGSGKLKIYRGKHPTWNQFPDIFKDPEDYITKSNRIEYADIIPYEKLLEDYRNQGVAVDLFDANFERELAAPNRTLTYLWCGLPVIVSRYFEISEDIEEYDAGWAVDPSDEDQIINIVKSILEDLDIVKVKSMNAQRLVREKYTWGKNLDSLEKFCKKPFKHERKESMLGKIMAENSQTKFENTRITKEYEELLRSLDETKEELRQAKDQLDYIRKSLPYKILKKVKHIFNPPGK